MPYDKEREMSYLRGFLPECDAITEHLTELVEDRKSPLNLLDPASGMSLLTFLAYVHGRDSNRGVCLANSEVISYLVSHGLDINLQTDQPRGSRAVEWGDPKILTLPLVAWGTNRETVLHVVCKTGYVEAFTVLLGHGARLDIEDVRGRKPMDCIDADRRNDFDVALDAHYGGQVRDLRIAAKAGDSRKVSKILERSPAILARDLSEKGTTALMLAATGETEEHLQCLHQLCAYAQASDLIESYLDAQEPVSGQTALHMAALNSAGAYELILRFGAKDNILDTQGGTPNQLQALTKLSNEQKPAYGLLAFLGACLFGAYSAETVQLIESDSPPVSRLTDRHPPFSASRQ